MNGKHNKRHEKQKVRGTPRKTEGKYREVGIIRIHSPFADNFRLKYNRKPLRIVHKPRILHVSHSKYQPNIPRPTSGLVIAVKMKVCRTCREEIFGEGLGCDLFDPEIESEVELLRVSTSLKVTVHQETNCEEIR